MIGKVLDDILKIEKLKIPECLNRDLVKEIVLKKRLFELAQPSRDREIPKHEAHVIIEDRKYKAFMYETRLRPDVSKVIKNAYEEKDWVSILRKETFWPFLAPIRIYHEGEHIGTSRVIDYFNGFAANYDLIL